jgi:DNA polymerase-1
VSRRLVFDIEGNGLLDTVTKVHCIEAVDPDTMETLSWGPDAIAQGLAAMETADLLIAHYGLGYDFGALEKVHGFIVPPEKQHDTVVTARLMFPNIKEADKALVRSGKLPGKLSGKHSIEAWGYRLGRPKLHTDIEDWSVWTPEMQERCAGDALTNVDLWKHLKADEYSQDAIVLEHEVQRLLFMMQECGVPFSEKDAAELHVNLLAKRETLEEELIAEYGFWYAPCKKRLDAHGLAETWTPKRDNPKLGYVAGAPLTKIEKVTFNPRSGQHCVKKLKELGWKPTSFTKGGEAELTDEVLESISARFPDANKLVTYRLLAKRLGMIADGDAAWLKKVDSEGLIHGRMNPMGTPHSRASHFDPNCGQVPANKKLYGKECRALFGAGHKRIQPGETEWVQVGVDCAGLQQRGLGHYLAPMDGGEYGRMVASKDIHWVYTQALGLVGEDVERDEHDELHEVMREMGGKRHGYSYLFGCFPPKTGSVIRDCCTTARQKGYPELYERYFGKGETNKQVGERVRKVFDEKLNLGALQKRLQHNYRLPGPWKGHIRGLDGRMVPCRSEHSLLNFALSSAEAIICKTWLVLCFKELTKRGYRWGWDGDFVFMLWVHDEIQCAARKGIEEEVGKIMVECATAAGLKLGFRVPVASKYKIGRTWAECH